MSKQFCLGRYRKNRKIFICVFEFRSIICYTSIFRIVNSMLLEIYIIVNHLIKYIRN